MTYTLVIVESPAKCKKIESYLGAGYKCIASFGHIRELPKRKGLKCIDKGNNYMPLFIESPSKKKQIGKLASMISSSSEVVLATDDDREGEAIAWHVSYLMNKDKELTDADKADAPYQIASAIKNKDGDNPKVYRVVFNSITKIGRAHV